MNQLIKNSPATIIIIACCAVVFIIQAIILRSILFDSPGDFSFLLYHGANFNPFIMSGEYWRLYSSMFMHWGIIHLVVNMYALYSIGIILEPFLGTKRFTLLYVLTGICAGISSLYFNVYAVSAGASGAIFGLYGYMITRQILVNYKNPSVLGGVLLNFLIFVGINYAIAKNTNVDTPAHLGGFVSGAAVALLHFFNILLSVWQFALATALSHLLVLAIPKDMLHYYNAFQHVIEAEERMQSVSQQLLTDQVRADSLREIIPVWNQAEKELRELTKIPVELFSDTSIIKKYVAFRIKDINYRLLGHEKESYVYLDSIEIIHSKMDSLPPIQHPLDYRPKEPVQPPDTITTPSTTTTHEWIKVYYDNTWRETQDISTAHYYRIGYRDSLQQWQGDVFDYYMNGNIQMKGRYHNGMHDGVFRYYTKNGRYESLGKYVKENAVGKWENYYLNKQLQREIYYGERSFTKSVYDSLGHQQVINGVGKEITWHSNGAVAEEGSYEKGVKKGYWRGYYSSGKPHYQELYHDGLLVQGVAMSEKGERYVYDQLSVFPFPVISMKEYKKYLVLHQKKTAQLSNHHGTTKVTFLVDINGDLRDFIITESVCIPCDKEAIRLIKEGPAWRPGVLRGHLKIRSRGFVEATF